MANYDGIADFASGVLRSALIIGGFVVGGLALAVMLGCDSQSEGYCRGLCGGSTAGGWYYVAGNRTTTCVCIEKAVEAVR
jgi:hypothetical protein